MHDHFQKKISQLPAKPGVYRFLDAHEHIIYVGKAKNLKKRVSQYFQKKIQDRKTTALMTHVVNFETTITDTENQALLLELNLIKEYRPKYNVLLRDDKSYPYLFLSLNHPFPRLDFHRGAKKVKGRYFGPYPNAGSVRSNLAMIQKLFKLRQCRDAFFTNRSRPCLQYQINRCTAPCVNYVTQENYQLQVDDAVHFLEGKNNEIMDSIMQRMQGAAEQKEYESAAHWRDVLIRMRKLQATQFVTGGKGDIDIFGACEKMGEIAIAVVSIRHGQLIGHKTFFPNATTDTTITEALSAFIPQYYFNPVRESQHIDRIVLSHTIEDRAWIENALQELMQYKVKIMDRNTSETREWQSIAVANASDALRHHQQEKNNILLKLEAFQNALHLPNLPERIECFDISHTQGTLTKASCVVFGIDGAIRKAYRQFNIDNITPGDDYAAMQQVLTRRYTQLKKDNKPLPDVILVDGGKGQLSTAAKVLETLQVTGVILVGVAKGPSRKAGVEKIWVYGHDNDVHLAENNPARHLIQFIRDEAHRFAITAHRKSRGKNQLRSILENIKGVGKKRRTDLLTHFGGLQEIKKASAEEISQVKGISRLLAKHIYDTLHEEN